jgi:hypothetical protein
MALIDDIKQALRITNTALDAEVQDLIDSAEADLLLSGVAEAKVYSNVDALIKRAIILYSKAFFGLNNADSDKYKVAYDSLKTHLCLSQEYSLRLTVM